MIWYLSVARNFSVFLETEKQENVLKLFIDLFIHLSKR